MYILFSFNCTTLSKISKNCLLCLMFVTSPVRTASPKNVRRALRAVPPVYSRTWRCQILRVNGGVYMNRSGRIGNATRRISATSLVD